MAQKRSVLLILSSYICLIAAAMALLRWPRATATLSVNRSRDSSHNQLAASLARLPLHFESTEGQAAGKVSYISRGPGYAVLLTPTEAVISFHMPKEGGGVLQMQLAGASPAATPEGLHALPGRINYLLGNDPSHWRTEVPTYSQIKYRDIYPGIDLVYYGNPQQLEFDFIVAPGASPDNIQLEFMAAENLAVGSSGELILSSPGQTLRLRKPVIYQESDGRRREIAGHYTLRGARSVGFDLAEYDAKLPLVIDPVLAYSTYWGATGWDEIHAIGVDAAGNVYVAGFSNAADFPTAAALQANKSGFEDVFISKISADGSQLIYSTYLGGNDTDDARALAVDGAGVVTVAGYTFSTNFPVANAFRTTKTGAGTADGFVARLDASGSALVYSTYLGGNGDDFISGLAVDGNGSAFVTGQTKSTNFPLANARQGSIASITDAFVTKFSPAGNTLVYSTYLGGNGIDVADGLAVDGDGNAYVTGYTLSTNFPLANAFQLSLAQGVCVDQGFLVPCYDAFVTKLSASGTQLVYSTYLGGDGDDIANGIALDANGSAYIAGQTFSTNFPTASALQPSFSGLWDGFVTKMSVDGASLVYSTYLGGQVNDYALAVAVNAAGEAYVAGRSSSSDFPVVDSLQPLTGINAVALRISADGIALLYSTFLGGSGGEQAYAIATDADGNAYVGGATSSSDFPVVNAIRGNFTLVGCLTGGIVIACPDGFLAKLTNQPGVFPGGMVNGASLAPDAAVAAGSVVAALGSNLATSIFFATQLPLPTVLGDLSVRMNGILTPLFVLSPGQILLQVPWELAGQSEATVQVSSGESQFAPITVNLAPIAPGLFALNGQGSGQGVILISNTNLFAAPAGSISGAGARAANHGEVVTIYCTGLGPVSNQPATGAASPGDPSLAVATTPPSVTIGGMPASVRSAGLSPGSVGLYRVEVEVPANAPSGDTVAVVITSGGALSNTVQMAIQ